MLLIDKKIKQNIEKYVKISNNSTIVYNISDISNIENIGNETKIFINVGLINNIRRINKFHEAVNLKLKNESYYVICSETLEERRKRVWLKAPYGFKFFLRLIDFILKRVLPKIPLLKSLYFFITAGHNRVMSKAEILGRLISCGFKIIEYFEHNNRMYVISKKIKSPDFNLNPSYGLFFKMTRVGYRGEYIFVHKIRTMYPYSEYLQELIIKENKLSKSGKISNDYRLTTWGKIMRKFWIDELPMIINFFKRDLNIVGVRPLSKHYFSLYPEDLRNLRIRFKPGLIPPYYADMPKNFNEILISERAYLEKKINYPLSTDIKYFFKASINILFKGARSR